ncbi:MAG: hypothetical protein E7Z87_03665 [Cyanobacteria bacterium SIG26]|nr:hypothetical protein [Cyanobacteria bacterium SIG26]MBQ7126210.1 hypothetical protein [bacterium]
MNFLELINKCLLELNYKQVHAFSELVKNDHKRIMTILNVVNKEICNTEKWNFLLRRLKFTLPANTSELDNPVNGRILYLFVDGKRYDFTEDIESFISDNSKNFTYSIFNNKLLFPKFNIDKTVDVIYYCSNCVVDEDDVEKSDFENPTDCSLIPDPFAEQILVYGTCLRLKASPQYYKFSYWMSMYKEALANLKSKTSVSVSEAPVIKLFRR